MKDKKQPQNKSMIFFISLTLFCIVFAGIYEFFSHQVYSIYMIGSFVFPLVLGVIPTVILQKRNDIVKPDSFAKLSYSFGIITFMVGSIFQGILDIYGTTNELTSVYWYVGSMLVVIGALSWLYQLVSQKLMKPENKMVSIAIILISLITTLGLAFYTNSQTSTNVTTKTNTTSTTTTSESTESDTTKSNNSDSDTSESDDTTTTEKSSTHSHSNSGSSSQSNSQGKTRKH